MRAARWVVPSIVLAIALGGVSLLLPGSPGYDQWSWLLWGRELIHGHLSLDDGTSWKPFPVAFTTIFALFGRAAPDLWLVAVRAFGLLAVIEAFRVGRRLAGVGAAGTLGGVAAVLGLTLTAYSYSIMVGGSETAVVLLALLAVDLHLGGHRRLALTAGWAVGLIRPEMWPLLLLYGAWLAWREPAARALVAGLGVGLAALWLVPGWLAEGNPFYGAQLAQLSTALTYGGHPDPVGRATADLRHSLLAPFPAGAVAGLAVGLASTARSRRLDALAIIVVGAAVWIGVDLALLAAGYAGAPRYFVGPITVLAVAGGAGWGRLVRVAEPRAAAVVIAAGLAAWMVVEAPDRLRHFDRESAVVAAAASAEDALPVAIHAAGGPRRLLACGGPVVPRFSVPMVAWYLGVAPAEVHSLQLRAVTLQERDLLRAPFSPSAPRAARRAMASAHWRLLTARCAAPRAVSRERVPLALRPRRVREG